MKPPLGVGVSNTIKKEHMVATIVYIILVTSCRSGGIKYCHSRKRTLIEW